MVLWTGGRLDFEFLKNRERQNKERERQMETGLLCVGPVQKAGSFLVPESRRFCRRDFCGFYFKPPTPFFSQKLWAGGQAGRRAGRVGSRASSCDAAGGSAAPPQPLSVHPPFFLTRARATCSLFFSWQSFGRCAPLAQLRGRACVLWSAKK